MSLGKIVRHNGDRRVFNSTREAGGSALILLPFTWAQSEHVLIPIVPHLITPTLSPPLNRTTKSNTLYYY